MISTGPFEWKQAPIKPHVRVEFDAKSITITEDNERETIQFSDVHELYFFRYDFSPLTRHMQLQIVLVGGKKRGLVYSNLAMMRSLDERQCLQAIICFLDLYERTAPHAELKEGFKTGKESFFSHALLLIVFAVIGLFTLRGAEFETSSAAAMVTVIYAAIAALTFFFTVRKQHKPARIRISELREGLEALAADA